MLALEEVKRVTSKNILITVPNCSDFNKLKFHGLTYEHMLEKDYVNFFTKTKVGKFAYPFISKNLKLLKQNS